MNIKRIIREEINDFEWTEGPINPWLEYDGIVFDIEPTREDVNMYIEQCLNTRKVDNASEWTEDVRETDIDLIIEHSYLGFYQDHTSESNLGYPIDPHYKTSDVILYSILKGQNIKEGMDEFDNLQWIRDIDDKYITISNVYEGMKVQITDESQYYYQGINQKDEKKEGTIIEIHERDFEGSDMVDVEWEDGRTYYYKIGPKVHDLEIYGYNKPTIKEEMEGLEWINNINTDKVGIRDLNIGDVVIIKCPRHKLIDKDEELTVSEIEDSYRTGEICVSLKNMKNMKYPFGKDREGVTNSVYVCEHINCDFYRLSF